MGNSTKVLMDICYYYSAMCIFFGFFWKKYLVFKDMN